MQCFVADLDAVHKVLDPDGHIIDALTKIVVWIEHFLERIADLIHDRHQLLKRYCKCIENVLTPRCSAHFLSKFIQVDASILDCIAQIQKRLPLILGVAFGFEFLF